MGVLLGREDLYNESTKTGECEYAGVFPDRRLRRHGTPSTRALCGRPPRCSTHGNAAEQPAEQDLAAGLVELAGRLVLHRRDPRGDRAIAMTTAAASSSSRPRAHATPTARTTPAQSRCRATSTCTSKTGATDQVHAQQDQRVLSDRAEQLRGNGLLQFLPAHLRARTSSNIAITGGGLLDGQGGHVELEALEKRLPGASCRSENQGANATTYGSNLVLNTDELQRRPDHAADHAPTMATMPATHSGRRRRRTSSTFRRPPGAVAYKSDVPAGLHRVRTRAGTS